MSNHRNLAFIVKVPPALRINALFEGLAAAGLPCKVALCGRLGIKVTAGRGVDRACAEAFVAGFIAGFEA
jgi:hypothetical protein